MLHRGKRGRRSGHRHRRPRSYGRISLPRDLGSLRGLIGVCWPFVVLEALQLVQFKIDTLRVFWILSSEAAAQYETAYRLLEVSHLAIRPLSTIAFPICALLIARHDRTAARDYGTKFVSIAAAIGLVVPGGIDLLLLRHEAEWVGLHHELRPEHC